MIKRILSVALLAAALFIATLASGDIPVNGGLGIKGTGDDTVKCTCGPKGSNKCAANGLGVHTCHIKDSTCWDSNDNCI
jgi:hypothetical protein